MHEAPKGETATGDCEQKKKGKSSKEKPPKQSRKREKPNNRSKLCEHSEFTHFPKDPNCDICSKCKTQRQRCGNKVFGRPDSMPEPQAFCDSITADHKILNDDDQSRSRDQTTLVVQDRYSSWLQGYASETKNTTDTKKGLTQFSGPLTKIKHAYTDNSKDLAKACD